jgi:TRAP-type C4-dicarboxylate transport system substrate-binding protein
MSPLKLLVPFLICSLSSVPARAESKVLRIAVVAPEGTEWARIIHSVGREVERETQGEVTLRLILGGIAGDELMVAERIKRGQLDGTVSGGMLCEDLSPTMRVLRVLGLYENRDQALSTMNQLNAQVATEMRQQGYTYFGSMLIGGEYVFSRRPVRTFEELKAAKLWRWDLDRMAMPQSAAMGLHAVAAGLEQGGPLYENGTVDGFFAIPSAALAWQWSARTPYVNKLELGYLFGCVVIANRAVDALTIPQQQALRAAMARGSQRVSEVGTFTDQRLLGGLLARQGVHVIEPSRELAVAFRRAAEASWAKLDARLLPPGLIASVREMLHGKR